MLRWPGCSVGDQCRLADRCEAILTAMDGWAYAGKASSWAVKRFPDPRRIDADRTAIIATVVVMSHFNHDGRGGPLMLASRLP